MQRGSEEEEMEEVLDRLSRGDLYAAEKLLHQLKDQDHVANFRYALVHVLRLILSGDRNLAQECLDRLAEAEKACAKASGVAEGELVRISNMDRNFLDTLRGKAAFSSPWAENTSDLQGEAFEKLKDWRRARGMQAFAVLLKAVMQFQTHAYVKGAWNLRNAWIICRHATDGDEDVPEARQTPRFGEMVKGVFMLMLTNVPPSFQRVFSIVGFESNKEKGLQCLNAARKDTEFETFTFASIIVALHHLLMSQQEYTHDTMTDMKRADEIINDLVSKQPNSPLGTWVQSHIIRRQGQMKQAMGILDTVDPLVTEQIEALERDDIKSYRLKFDRASLHFVAGDYNHVPDLLAPLVVDESTFNSKILASALLSASNAMLGDDEAAFAALERMESVPEKGRGRMDRSIMLKHSTLRRRKSRKLLAYEILYIFGHIKSYSPISGEGSIKWLDARAFELEEIGASTGFSVEGVSDPNFDPDQLNEDNLALFEEWLSTMLIRGAIQSLKRELDDAEAILSVAVQAIDKAKVQQRFEDPYVLPWTLYELGCIRLLKNDHKNAKKLFQRATKLSKSKEFSFDHMLNYKCSGALRVIREEH